MSFLTPRIIILEGPPGAGKTKLGSSIHYWLSQNNIPVMFMPEEVDEIKLANYISNMKKKATDFQNHTADITLRNLSKAKEFVNQGYIVIVDRGIVGNRCFAEIQHDAGFISEKEIKEYRQKFATDILDKRTETWYLECSVETCLKRIARRDRNGESSYTTDYLEKLEKEHNKLLTSDRIINRDMDYELTVKGFLPENIVTQYVIAK